MILYHLLACSEQGFHSPGNHYPDSNPQGLTDNPITDRIIKATATQTDILFTIDSSESMGPYQTELIASLPDLLDYIVEGGQDFHAGVITTDLTHPVERGKLHTVYGYRWIDNETPDMYNIFQQMGNVGIRGSTKECGIGTTYYALGPEADRANNGFRREDAVLTTLVITDEDDSTSDIIITDDEFINWYSVLTRFRSFNGIVNYNGYVAGYYGYRYIDAIEAIGGKQWDIMDGINPETMGEFSGLTTGQDGEYFLSHKPVDLNLDVQYEVLGNTIVLNKRDWEYTDIIRNSIILDDVPPPGSLVYITYFPRY